MPGITDYATLEYRDEQEILNSYTETEEGYIKEVLPAKIALYEKYLLEMSLTTDLKIIVKTILRILF
jgi:lipopolysaccharide/colanic/teichoic acid biosynthesis glycosyltransferase